jgi:hypothetical protein
MRPTVCRAACAAFLIAGLAQSARAQPANPDLRPHDPVASVTPPSPWLDLGTTPIVPPSAPAPPGGHKLAAALTLGGLYAGFATWTYFAWYRKHKPLDQFKWGGDGWFGAETYAGGADKLGHAWATMGLARAGTELLNQWGGFDRTTSSIVGAALSQLLFLAVEVKDGAYYEFSFGDAAFNTAGAVAAVALSLSPRLDELFDFRVEYWPSREYRRQLDGGNVNIAEDYTGETYLLALHLGALHTLRDTRWGGLTRFVDVAVGFGTRGYKPDPPPGTEADYPHRQELSIGVSLNLQGVSDWVFGGRSRAAAKIGHGVFEMFNAGYLPAVQWDRTPTGQVVGGGA